MSNAGWMNTALCIGTVVLVAACSTHNQDAAPEAGAQSAPPRPSAFAPAGFPPEMWQAALDYDWGDEVALRSNGRTYPSDSFVPAQDEPDWDASYEALVADAATCTRADYANRIRYPMHNAVVELYDPETGPNALLVRQAESGNPEAMYNLAYMGSMVPMLMGQAEIFDWMMRAAEAGHSYAALDVGRAYQSGSWGVDRDDDLALQWLTIAADRGEPEAQYALAIIEPDDETDLQAYAVTRLERELSAAAACHPMAAFLIADRLREGGRGLRQAPDLAAQIGLSATTSF